MKYGKIAAILALVLLASCREEEKLGKQEIPATTEEAPQETTQKPAEIPVSTTEPPPPSPREEILQVGIDLIGTTEKTGKNDGPIIEEILHSVGLKKGDPYCAAFNYYCYSTAGYGEYAPQSGWSPDWVKNPTWTLKNGGQTPLPADAFGIYFKSKERVAHTGLVRKWGKESVLTVEGNTSPQAQAGSSSDRQGDGIWSKRRLVSQIYSAKNWLDAQSK